MIIAKNDELTPFLSTSQCMISDIFTGERFPNVVVSTDGTVVATWGQETYAVRRSEDGGQTWGPRIDVATPGFHGGGVTVDEQNDTILVFAETNHPPGTPQKIMGALNVFKSADHGKSWQRMDVTIHPDANGNVPARHMSEHGISLQYGPHAGRLVRPARVYNKPGARPARYACALYSDDAGATWSPSAPFPEGGTGECALTELSDGSIYFSARKSYFDTAPETFDANRRIGWSMDGGETWQNLAAEKILPDGPQYRGEQGRGSNYNGHFGMFAGLTRLPLEEHDILLYSNADTPDHERKNGTVWGSFDGGRSWPVKRVVHKGPFAYSSLTAGRPGTPSEGWIYLQFEGGDENCYEGGSIARFNLSWLLEGEPTGDGEKPEPYTLGAQ
ncbi:MAG: glycoside hydrolase [Candidatus Pacebacteria bacterium]|nr:glycoside hydrolase [Candidatus Paceibacterota bacterium]